MLIGLGITILSVVLGGPVMYLVQENNLQGAWIVGSIAGIIGLVVFVVCFLVEAIAPSFIVIYNLKIRDALDQSFALVKQSWATLLGFGFILLLIQALPVVILSLLAYYIDGLAVKISLFAALFLLQIALAAFQEIAWVLAFLELIKPEKISQEELAEVPEPAAE